MLRGRVGQPQPFKRSSGKERSRKGCEAGIQVGNANASRYAGTRLHSDGCKSKKGPVWACMSARDKNGQIQLAALPLLLLRIPRRIFCWPGQIRWFLGPTSAPGQIPYSPGQTPGLAALHQLSCAAWCQHGNPALWGAEVAVGVFGALLQAGTDVIIQEGKQLRPAAGVWDRDGDTLRWEGTGKVRAKRSLWDGRFAFNSGQQRNVKVGG